ncbi:MAG: hypothetical protein AAF849_21915 [Bacteroidota bacterium]
MDQPISPSEKKYNKLLPVLPFLLFAVLLLGKKQNRTVLKGQIAYIMADRAKDLESVYEDLEGVLIRNLAQSYGEHLFRKRYEEKLAAYPRYEAEISMIATHLARKYGGEFVVWKNNAERQISIYGLGKNEIPNVDEIPYFKGCKELSKIGRAICSEHQLYQFIQEEKKEITTDGSITIAAKVGADGTLRDLKPIKSSSTPEEIVREALRISGKMPKWEAAKRAGESVECPIFLSFVFTKSGLNELYPDAIDVEIWRQSSKDIPLYQAEQAEQELKRLMSMCLRAESNKERELCKVQFQKKIRQLLLDYPEQEGRLADLVVSEAKEMDISINLHTDRADKLVDISLTLDDYPEPNYNDQDKIYADLLEIIDPYESQISIKAEIEIENALGDLFWDFIDRFPDHVNMAQAALQHACNIKKIPTHTVKIQKEQSQVVIDLVGRKRK